MLRSVTIHFAVLSFGSILFLSCKSVRHSSDLMDATGGGKCSVYTESDLPTIYNCSNVTDKVSIEKLVRRAKDGLGFPDREGPRAGDFMYVGNYYMAWIDNTGYSGKMNAFWTMNNQVDHFDFTLTEPTPNGDRPVSMLLPGEDGDGKWGRAYNGAEHYELPRYKNGQHSAQAGIREANHFTDAPDSWKQCINADNDAARWDRPVGDTTEEIRDDGSALFKNIAQLRIVMRINKDSYACNTLFPLESGEAADIRLASGYIFYPDSPKIERSYQMLNYSNKDLKTDGIKKLIGGQLLTDWPHPHYLKQFQKWIKWDDNDLVANTFQPYDGAGQTADIIEVHGSGSMMLNAIKDAPAGRTIAMKQTVSPSAGEDFGYCLCKAHGGFEFTGSLLAGQDIKAAKNGQATGGPVQMRTILVDGTRDRSLAKQVQSTSLKAATLESGQHEIGRLENDAWTVNTASKYGKGGYLVYKKYVSVPGNQVGQAAFNLKIDSIKGSNDEVAAIDLVWKGSQVLASKLLKRSDFYANNKYQRFALDFETPSSGEIEPRLRWLNKAAMTVDSIIINTIEP